MALPAPSGGGTLVALLKKATRAPTAKKPDDTDEDDKDRRALKLAAIREFRNAKSDDEAVEAFDALMEQHR